MSHIILTSCLTMSPVATLCAVLPDVSMPRREDTPPKAYLWAHSIWPVLLLLPLSSDASIGWLSHILLDLLTHGRGFAPRLLYPLAWRIPGPFGEWEFYNRAWFLGLGVTLCIVVYRMVIIYSLAAQ